MSYKVKLNFFEGPLDLLLFLIKKERIEIIDIPISKITKQYLSYLEILQLLDLEIAGEFLVMAATLMHIKSKMLLPKEETLLEEEEEDPRDELVRKLLEYKRYKEAAGSLRDMMDTSKMMFLRRGEGEKAAIFSDKDGDYFEASLFDLITAFRKVLGKISKKQFHQVVRDKFTVADKMHVIYHILAQHEKIKFTELFKDSENKDEVIATFLAVLELIKIREIVIVQQGAFADIDVIRSPKQVPE